MYYNMYHAISCIYLCMYGYIKYLQPLQRQCYLYIDRSSFKESLFKKYGMHGSVICIMWKFGNRYYFKNRRQLPTNKWRKLARQQNKSIVCLFYSKQYYRFVVTWIIRLSNILRIVVKQQNRDVIIMHEICYCCSSMVSIEKPQIFIFTSDVIQLRFTTQSTLPLSFLAWSNETKKLYHYQRDVRK